MSGGHVSRFHRSANNLKKETQQDDGLRTEFSEMSFDEAARELLREGDKTQAITEQWTFARMADVAAGWISPGDPDNLGLKRTKVQKVSQAVQVLEFLSTGSAYARRRFRGCKRRVLTK